MREGGRGEEARRIKMGTMIIKHFGNRMERYSVTDQ